MDPAQHVCMCVLVDGGEARFAPRSSERAVLALSEARPKEPGDSIKRSRSDASVAPESLELGGG